MPPKRNLALGLGLNPLVLLAGGARRHFRGMLSSLDSSPQKCPGIHYGKWPADPIRNLGVSASDSTIERYTAADPDVRLMLQVRDDNAAAFEELVLRYQNRLITVLEHLVGRQGIAEDLAQDVFLRVYGARKRYKPGAKFSTWLFTIANNVARNALRSRSRRHEVNLTSKESEEHSLAPGLDQMAVEESGLSPSRELARTELADVVRLALETLPERQKMAILLSKYEEMSYADIAEVMEMSIPATKSLLSRARVNLKEALRPYLEEGMQPGIESPAENAGN